MGKSRIKVLQVLSGLDIGGGHGGAERFGLELARSLDRNHFDVSICAFWRRGTSSEAFWHRSLRIDGIQVHFAVDWKGKFRIRDYIQGVRNLIHLCQREEIELLHSHFQMGTMASLINRFFSPAKHIVRTAHITLEWGERPIAWLMRSIFTNWIFPLLLDKEFGVSNAIVQQLRNHPGARLVKKTPRLIYNAINPQIIRKQCADPLPPDLEIGKDDLVIGSIGRLVRQKAYEYLVMAAPDILRSFPRARFIIIGEGDDRQALEDLAKRNGTRDRFHFLGQVDEVYPILNRMTVFVLPSRWEGFPTVLLESMVCGIPIVATDIPGTDELIKDQVTGWLVPAESSADLVDAVNDVLTDQEKRERIIRNAKSLSSRYTFSNVSLQYWEAYREILLRS
jgi:glycosyltransferase involved in cell wall biosynthesis